MRLNTSIFATLDEEKPDTENTRAVKLTTVTVSAE
jgi:hypothetical protein